MALPLVSVIIPCFAQAGYLGEAIRSVLAQTYRHFEVIVVDDGSPDDVSAVTVRFPDIHLIRQKNMGQAAARNRGLHATTGELVVFLDADDRLLPDALRVGAESLASHPDCAFVYGHVRLIGSDGSPVDTPPQQAVLTDHYVRLLSANYIWSPGAVMYRRSVLAAGAAFDSRADGAADYELNVRIAREFPIVCHDQAVLEYRVHDSNWSRDPEAMLRSAVTAQRLQRKHVKASAHLLEAYRAGLQIVQRDYGERLVSLIGERVRSGQWTAAVRGTTVLMRYYPRGLVRHMGRKMRAALGKRGQA